MNSRLVYEADQSVVGHQIVTVHGNGLEIETEGGLEIVPDRSLL